MLAAIGEYLQADRAYIFEFSDDVVRNTFEWCREGVVPQKEFLANVPVGGIARWMPNFYAHQPILITDLESLRVTSPEEYAVLKRQDIHSLLVFPLWNGKSLRGFVGVDNLDPERIDSSRVLLSSMKFFLSSSLWRRDSLNELHFLSYHDQLPGCSTAMLSSATCRSGMPTSASSSWTSTASRTSMTATATAAGTPSWRR